MFVTGALGVDVELECVNCLKRFIFPIRVHNFAAQIELKGPRIGRLDAVDSRGYSPRSSSSSALRLGPEDEVRRTAAEIPERRRESQSAKCLGCARPFKFEPKEVS